MGLASGALGAALCACVLHARPPPLQAAGVRKAHMRGGTPSMIAPTPLQCDSPKVVTRKIVPKVDMPLEVMDERAPKALSRSSCKTEVQSEIGGRKCGTT